MKLCRQTSRYLQKVNTMSFFLLLTLAHSCIENMAEQNNVVIEKLPEKLKIF